MAERARRWVAPIYLFACLVLGDAQHAAWQNMILQIAGLAILAWAAAASAQPLAKEAKVPLVLAIAGIAVVAIQTLPLPSLVPLSGVRSRIASDLSLLDIRPTVAPLSLSPYASLSSLLCMIPPFAMYSAMVRQHAYRTSLLVAALLAGTAGSIVLAATVSQLPSGFQPYGHGTPHAGLGPVASANRVADLLLIAVPFAVAAASGGRLVDLRRERIVGFAFVVGLLVVALALTKTVAGYSLAIPVLAASLLMLTPRGSRSRKAMLVVGGLSLATAIIALSLSPIDGTAVTRKTLLPSQSRGEILATTGAAILDFMPVGSGLGSFPSVYPLYERPEAVTPEPIMHAHNDYAELALELGLAGVALMFAFLMWWVAAMWRVWRDGGEEPFRRAASIATAALMVQSLFDFPLRTSSIGVAFAMCLGLLVTTERRRAQQRGDLRPTRHVVIA